MQWPVFYSIAPFPRGVLTDTAGGPSPNEYYRRPTRPLSQGDGGNKKKARHDKKPRSIIPNS